MKFDYDTDFSYFLNFSYHLYHRNIIIGDVIYFAERIITIKLQQLCLIAALYHHVSPTDSFSGRSNYVKG